MKIKTPFKRILSWYFSKNSLPYWVLLLNDCLMVFLATVTTFWMFEKTQLLFDQRFDVIYTAVAYALLSIIGARAFRTYSGVLRYSSFVDLLQVGYANLLTMVLAVILSVADKISLYPLAALCLSSEFDDSCHTSLSFLML